MQHILEIFLTKFDHEQVVYHRVEIDITQQTENPDELVLLAVQKYSSQIIGRQRLISHSTSWRYVEGGKTIITYIVYSDDFEFTPSTCSLIDFSSLKILDSGDAAKPAPNNITVENVISHGIRHLAYLVVHNPSLYAQVINTDSLTNFHTIDKALAGKI